MSCKNTCKVCDRLVFSQAVTFAAGVLTINLPARAYNRGCKYCFIITQDIPATATIDANVVITIGAVATAYPLLDCCGAQVTAGDLSTRTRYAVKVVTDATSGSFKLLGRLCCANNNALESIGTA